MAKGRRRRLKPVKLWKELPILLGVALILALLIKTFAVQAYFIPSQSMENTIKPGDRVLVNKLSPWFDWKPQRGEVVVFKDPGGWLDAAEKKKDNAFVGGVKTVFSFVGLLPSSNEQDLIKRVIGVPGDEVACLGPGQPVTVNGIALAESAYLFPADVNQPSAIPPTGFRVTVAPDTVFVLGDHRSDSGDSRVHLLEPTKGMVPFANLQGHAFVRIWPLSRFGNLDVPETFHQKAVDRALETIGSAVGSAPLLAGLTFAVPLRAGLRRRSRQGSTGELGSISGVTKWLLTRLGTVRQRGRADRVKNREGKRQWTRQLRNAPDLARHQKGRR